jgi:putative transposase
VPHDVRDLVVDFVRRWSEKAEIGVGRFIPWLGVTASKFYDWRQRYGCVNEHNGWVPRDFWLEPWEKEAIIGFHLQNPLEGYRRLTFMMLDADVVAVSPASVWRVLKQAGLLSRWKRQPSRKGEWVRAAAATAPALAYRCFQYQPVRHLLLLVQCSGRGQPFPRALGFA